MEPLHECGFDFVTAQSRIKTAQQQLIRRADEVRSLMDRVQELSSRYTPLKSDPLDVSMAKYIVGYRPAVPFVRLSSGKYLFGTREVFATLKNEKPVFRVGGGFLSFGDLLESCTHEELRKIMDRDAMERDHRREERDPHGVWNQVHSESRNIK